VEEYLAKKAESEKKATEEAEKVAEADKKATTNDKTTEGDDKTTKVEKKESEKAAEALTEAAPKKAKDETRSISNTTVSSIQKRALSYPQKPLSHKEYVEDHIERNSLPPGYVHIRAKNYILRYAPIRFPLSTPLTRKQARGN
jgi:mannosyl-oligosaccharide alpha-1,2-mannosidase